MQKKLKIPGGHGKFDWKSRGVNLKKNRHPQQESKVFFFWKSPITFKIFSKHFQFLFLYFYIPHTFITVVNFTYNFKCKYPVETFDDNNNNNYQDIN